MCDEKPISILETGTRISFFQSHVRDGNENFSLSISCSRREREFLSLNLVLRDENENFIFQSRASRRERESRLRQFSREFSGITFFAFLLIDIFQKKWVFFKISWNNMSFFSREIWRKISISETRTGIFFINLVFRDENGNIFYQSRVSRREREIENDFSRSSGKKLSWFSREFPGTGIPVTLWHSMRVRHFNLK